MILLIVDGVRFREHDFTLESDLEGLVEAHSRDIFGIDSLYFGKKKIASVLGTGSVPDGYAICFQGSPQWYVIEIELSSHSRSHMLDQLSRFFSGLENESARSSLVDFMETELRSQPELEAKVRKRFGEVYKFLSHTINKTTPTNLLIVDKNTVRVQEVARTINQVRILEFKVLERDGVGLAVNAVMFEPIEASSKLKPRADKTSGAKGAITTQSAYTIPILACLIEAGGNGKVSEILEKIKGKMTDKLKPADFERVKSGAIRWRNHALWERQSLIDLGYLKKGSPRGLWEITEKGREYYSNSKPN